MRELFKRTARMAVSLELVDLPVQAVDGTLPIVSVSLRNTVTIVVELRGFEPLTSSVQRRRSPGLSYSPTRKRLQFAGKARMRPALLWTPYKRKHLNDWIVERASP